MLLVVPGFLLSGILIWLQPWALQSKLMLLGTELFVCLLIGTALHDHIIRPLQTLANVVGALREEDYSFRARLAVQNDALGELSIEVNALADLLAENRTGAIEAAALVQRVVEEVDIPIFAFDPAQRLRLVSGGVVGQKREPCHSAFCGCGTMVRPAQFFPAAGHSAHVDCSFRCHSPAPRGRAASLATIDPRDRSRVEQLVDTD
ncbi:MAG: hypothetical protein DMG92_02545 [Acidobacteria bacterium]|nr:MAG: hypothetical protein DMG92_02545 [Acidobacteriota bacterium]